MLMFGSFGGGPPTGGPVASREAGLFIPNLLGPGEFTVWDIFWSILRIFTLWNKPSLRTLKTFENYIHPTQNKLKLVLKSPNLLNAHDNSEQNKAFLFLSFLKYGAKAICLDTADRPGQKLGLED